MKNLYSLIVALLSVTLVSAQSQIDLPITWDDTANVNYAVGRISEEMCPQRVLTPQTILRTSF